MGACPTYDLIQAISPHGGHRHVLAKIRSVVETASTEDGTVAVLSKNVVGTNGGEPVRLTENAAEDVNPVFSPDGRSIAFGHVAVRNHGGVDIIATDGTGERRVASTEGAYSDPDPAAVGGCGVESGRNSDPERSTPRPAAGMHVLRAGFNRVARERTRGQRGEMRRLSRSGGTIPVLLAVCPAVACLLAVSAQSAGAHGSCDQRGHAHSSHRYAPRIYMHHDEHGDGHGCDGRDDDRHGGNDHHGDDHHHGSSSPSCTTYLPGTSREVPTNTIEGTPGPDKIVGTNGPDLIYGFGGADRIYGGGGDDHVIGGPGDDRIDGANDDDNLWGGPGDDSIRGANGSDHVVGGNGHDRLDGGAGCDNMLGGSSDDELEGGPDVDKLDGDNAAPVFGFGAADSCDGGPGDDLFVNCELP